MHRPAMWGRACCNTTAPATSLELASCSGGTGPKHGSFAPLVQPSSGRRSRTFSRLSMISCTSSSADIAASPPVFSAMCSNSPSRRRIRAKRTVVTRSFAEPWCVCSARRRLSSSRCSVLITAHGSGRVLIESQADTSPRAIRTDAPRSTPGEPFAAGPRHQPSQRRRPHPPLPRPHLRPLHLPPRPHRRPVTSDLEPPRGVPHASWTIFLLGSRTKRRRAGGDCG